MSTAETTIVNRLDELARVTGLVDQLAVAHRLSPDVVADMNVALDEILSNIITHAYADDGVHEIRIRLTVYDDVLVAEVEDDGRPFDPVKASPPKPGASLRERSIGGLGIHFVKNLMTEVTYSRTRDRNHLLLKKRLRTRSEAEPREHP